jgi:hypothetical protein
VNVGTGSKIYIVSRVYSKVYQLASDRKGYHFHAR